jgi:hypothetical protein
MLQQPDLTTPGGPVFADGGVGFPEGHRAYAAWTRSLGFDPATLEWTLHNLANGPALDEEGRGYDIDRQIEKARAWWKLHGSDFVRGRAVPRFTTFHFFYAT